MRASGYRDLCALCEEPLAYALEVAAGVRRDEPAEVRQRLLETLDGVLEEGRRRGRARADLHEIRYALIAFIDEQLLETDWSGRAEWMRQPLQLLAYHENAAGEGFFVRLRRLLEAGDRPWAVLAYDLCLSLGFHGAYDPRADARALSQYARAARRARAQCGYRASDALPPPRLSFEPAAPSPWRTVARAALVSASLVLVIVGGIAAFVQREREQCLSAIASAAGRGERRP